MDHPVNIAAGVSDCKMHVVLIVRVFCDCICRDRTTRQQLCLAMYVSMCIPGVVAELEILLSLLNGLTYLRMHCLTGRNGSMNLPSVR